MQKRIQQFFYDLKYSFYNQAFYENVHKRTVWDGFINFILVGVLVGLVFVVLLFVFIFQEARYSVLSSHILETYPDELVLTVEDGYLQKNITDPIRVPTEGQPLGLDMLPHEHLLVVDTRENMTRELYDTYVFVGDTEMTVEGDATLNEVHTYTFEDIDSLEINEALIETFLADIKIVYYVLLTIAPIIIIVFFTMFVSLMYALFSLAGAVVVYAVSKVKDCNYSFGQSYVVAMYVMLPVIVYDLFTDLVGFGNMFALGALLFIALALANIKPLNPKEG